jgi:hypothetical protein
MTDETLEQWISAAQTIVDTGDNHSKVSIQAGTLLDMATSLRDARDLVDTQQGIIATLRGELDGAEAARDDIRTELVAVEHDLTEALEEPPWLAGITEKINVLITRTPHWGGKGLP